jgi:type I restriction enzyme, R subunit
MLTGVEWQNAKYVGGLPDLYEPAVKRGGLAFVYESTGIETRFTNRLDPDPTSRPVFTLHRPETL